MPSTVWKGRLAFGMVAIPVRLYKAARRERVQFHQVVRRRREEMPLEEPEPPERPEAPERPQPPAAPRPILRDFPASPADAVIRVHNQPVAESSGAPVERTQVLKGYELEKDRYVTFDRAEVQALRPQTSTEVAIGEFVRLQEIDPVYFDASYYAAPDDGGEKPYALLYRALAETGYAAVGTLAMHGREHAAVIRPGQHGLIVHTLFFQKEVRAEEEYRADAAQVNARELELAKMLVQALAAPFDASKLKDAFEERLHALIEERAATAVETYREGVRAPAAPVLDIQEALRKSLEMVRRPPAAEKKAVPKASRSAGGRPRRAKG